MTTVANYRPERPTPHRHGSKLDIGQWANFVTASEQKAIKAIFTYFHQNLRHLTFWILDYKKSNEHKHDSIFGHFRCITILTWLQGFRVKNDFFKSFFCLSISKRDLNTKKTPPNIDEVCPERLRSMLDIERSLLVFVLNGCSLALHNCLGVRNSSQSTLY